MIATYFHKAGVLTAIIATIGLCACGGSTTLAQISKTTTPAVAPSGDNGATVAGGDPATEAAGSATGSAAPGAAVPGGTVGGSSTATLTCDKFPAVDLLAAVQTVAPKTTAGSVKTERLADEFGSPLVCDYDFASNIKPGLDPTTVIGQDIHFSIRISDGSVAGIPTPQVIRDGFAKERDVAKHDAKGDATADTQFVFLAVDGIGDGAYFGDYITRDNGVTGADESDLSVLRATVPMTVEVKFGYSTQPDTAIAAPALADDPFQNDSRHTIVEAVARAILAKL